MISYSLFSTVENYQQIHFHKIKIFKLNIGFEIAFLNRKMNSLLRRLDGKMEINGNSIVCIKIMYRICSRGKPMVWQIVNVILNIF